MPRDQAIERPRSEKERKEPDLFRMLVEGVRDYAIFLLDPGGHVISWNRGAARLKGYSAEEIIGSHFSRFYAEQDRYKCPVELAHAVEHGSCEDEGWRVRKDGSRFWASVVITALRDESGRLVGFAKITRDLTERKEAESALLLEREARARAEAADQERRLLQAVLAGIDDGITLQDKTGKLLFANERAARIVGFSSAEALLAAPLSEVMQRFEMFTEDGRPFPVDRLPSRAVLQGGAGDEVLVSFRVRATEESRSSLVRALPVLDADGNVVRAINVFRDVTERQREEQQRRFILESVKEFNSSLDFEATLANVAKQLVPALADWCAIDILDGDDLRRLGVAHVDPEKIRIVEQLARDYPSDPDAPGSPRHILHTAQPVLIKTIPRELLRARARSPEHLALIESLQLRSFLAVPIVARSRPLGVLTLAMAESWRTYTERDLEFAMTIADRAAVSIDNARLFREKEIALAHEKEARQDAERVVRFSEEFVGVLGHDLRNPLSAIGIGAHIILRTAQDDKQRRPATRILASVDRMARMIEQLLDFTRIRIGGGLPIEACPMDLDELARQIIEETEAAHRCTIQYECAGDAAGTWDRDRLAQVLSNLLANAAQHGGGQVLARVDGRDAEVVKLEVRNHGEIPPDVAPDIFHPFRGGAGRRGAARGLGLGLYITREMVRAHGGSIEMIARDGHTSFALELPRRATRRRA